MFDYTVRRLLIAVPTLVIISLVIFLVLSLAPNDPMAQVPLSVPPQVKEKMRDNVLDGGNRLDGRKLDEIRQITCDIDYLPSVHGSAVFTRGETQALVTTTLGTSQDAKK